MMQIDTVKGNTIREGIQIDNLNYITRSKSLSIVGYTIMDGEFFKMKAQVQKKRENKIEFDQQKESHKFTETCSM